MNQQQYKVNVRRVHSPYPYKVYYRHCAKQGITIDRVILRGRDLTDAFEERLYDLFLDVCIADYDGIAHDQPKQG